MTSKSLTSNYGLHPFVKRYLGSNFQQLHGGQCSNVYANRTLVVKVPFQGEEVTHGWRASLLMSKHGGLEIIDHDRQSGSLDCLLEIYFPKYHPPTIRGLSSSTPTKTAYANKPSMLK